MPEDPALIWEKATPDLPRREQQAAEAGGQPPPPLPVDLVGERIPLREAHHRFGIAVSTLRGWARAGKIDGALDQGRWMVAPASVAAHLSARRHAGARPPRSTAAPMPPPAAASTAPASSGPTVDGTAMLVPRDSWDKLMDQLGNLHEAGQQLAVARERAAKAETEATFLRERLGEMREERDRLQSDTPAPRDRPASGPPSQSSGGLIGWVRRALWGDRQPPLS